jgi:hypothetical protein
MLALGTVMNCRGQRGDRGSGGRKGRPQSGAIVVTGHSEATFTMGIRSAPTNAGVILDPIKHNKEGQNISRRTVFARL